MPLLPEFLQLHPQLKLHWFLNDNRIDLSAQDVDMAIRMTHLSDSGMVARRIGQVQVWLVAALAMLKHHGMPRQPHDVSRMPCCDCSPTTISSRSI